MELEQLLFGESISAPKADRSHVKTYETMASSISSSSKDSDELSHASESFTMIDMSVPKTVSAEKKLAWLRSQIVVGDGEFKSPMDSAGSPTLITLPPAGAYTTLKTISSIMFFPSMHDKVDANVTSYLLVAGNTHTCDSFVGDRTTKMVHEATKYVKKCLGGKQDDALVFCGSGTTAAIKRLQEVMGITSPSIMRERVLKTLRSEERWVVFVGPYEHHSNLLSWRQSLAEVVEIGLDENGLIDMKALKQQLESYKYTNRPLLGSFSACSNVTGIYTNTRALAKILHQHGAFVCFDFAASGPYVEIDMRSGEIDGYDAIFLSPHKFLGGPGTPGILLMSKVLYNLASSPPSTCGGGTVAFVNGFNEKDTLYVDEIEEREDAGTPPIVQKIKTALTFWVKEYIGYNVIEQMEHMYIEAALERLLPNPNIKVLGNTSAKRQAILSFLVYSTTNSSSDGMKDSRGDIEGRFYMWRETGNKRGKPLHGPFVAKLLNDLFGIQARGGCACAGPYGHSLLNVDETRSLAFRSAIHNVNIPLLHIGSFLYTTSIGKTGNWTFKKKALKDALAGKENNGNFGGLSLARGMQASIMSNQSEAPHNNADENDEIINKYTSYLETAKRIASLLEKFPPHRRVPEDIDLNLCTFRC
ncbi:putative cysteine desulfurase [Vitis vinifera]|uniref:Putative cysteine desulfurase n=1 Tax=Vitis vinifera TaxID=29760 RepID=A0A438HQX4_VITVI|nr:putative cysteine desulfurase [Vitis vinifera]